MLLMYNLRNGLNQNHIFKVSISVIQNKELKVATSYILQVPIQLQVIYNFNLLKIN